jgi:Zn-dependent protease/predicted transcriptional regulator
MRDFRLASVLGFEVRIDASWFVIFFLVLWSFTVAVFPARVSGLTGGVYFALGLVGALLFFATLLAHELAHSIVARSKGIGVEGITLFLFGGVARTKSEARTPGDEFLIAGVGPLASVLIAIALFGAAVAGHRLGFGLATTVLFEYIALLNLALAIFNLLPGFPLDGGRMFRAILWRITGSMRRATRIATLAGRWIGYALVLFGALSALSGAIVGGLWLALIGWFLRNAAVATDREQLARELLDGARADQIMAMTPFAVSSDLTLDRFFNQIARVSRISDFPVVSGDVAVGIVNVKALEGVPRDRWGSAHIEEVMTPIEPETIVQIDDSMLDVLDRVRASASRRVLVLDNRRIAGIITPHDITAWLERARQLDALGKRSEVVEGNVIG